MCSSDLVEVEVLELIESIHHAYPDKSVSLEFYRCRLVGQEPRAVDCQAIAWVDRDELSRFEFPAADDRLLTRLRTDAALWATRPESG